MARSSRWRECLGSTSGRVLAGVMVLSLLLLGYATWQVVKPPPRYIPWVPPSDDGVEGGQKLRGSGELRVSLVLMSFSRPNYVRTIVRRMLDDGQGFADMVKEVIVWNANPEEDDLHDLLLDDEAHSYVPRGRVRVFEARTDPGLHARYASALLAREKVVLIQDDDLLLEEWALRALLERQQEERDVIHGLFGRFPVEGKYYGWDDDHTLTRAPIVLTKALVAGRDLFSAFFAVSPLFDAWAEDAKPVWNGEDIVFNLAVVRRNHGKLNRKHPDLIPGVSFLDDSGGVSYWKEHISYREQISERCFNLLAMKPNPEPKKGMPIKVTGPVDKRLALPWP